jgi:hypothetical protein
LELRIVNFVAERIAYRDDVRAVPMTHYHVLMLRGS